MKIDADINETENTVNIYLTFKQGVDFDPQTDTYLFNGTVDETTSAGSRAYLLMDSADGNQETVALWQLTDKTSQDMLTKVLDVPMPTDCTAKPWFIYWIKDGQIHIKHQMIGVDQGVHLIELLSAYDVLDRSAHLF